MWSWCRPIPLPESDLKNRRRSQRSWPLTADVAAILAARRQGIQPLSRSEMQTYGDTPDYDRT